MNLREQKNIEKKIDYMIDFIKEEMADERHISCILSTIGIIYVSEHKYAKEYLNNKYQISCV